MSEQSDGQPTSRLPARPARRFAARHITSLGIAAGITLGVFLLRGEISRLGHAGYFGIFVTMLLTNATLILPAPGLALVFVLGKTFSPLLLGLAAGAGSTLGELTGYLAGFSGSGLVENIKAYQRIEDTVKKDGVFAVALLAAIPNPLFDAAGFAAGALGIKWWQFLLATFVGKTIKCVAVAYAGFYSMGVIEKMLSG